LGFNSEHPSRLFVDRLIVNGMHETADSARKARRERDGFSVQNGACEGRVRVRRLPRGFLAASLTASCESRRWWEPTDFGLRGQDTAVLTLRLPGFARGLTGTKTEIFWTKPFFPRSLREIPPKTQFLLWQEKDGRYGVLLPLAGGTALCHLQGAKGAVDLVVTTGQDALRRMEGPLFVAGFGMDPYRLVEDAYRAAARYMGRTACLRVNKRYPEPFEYLGWCTWDAFYRGVSAGKILAQLGRYRRQGVRMGFVLVDDGWYPVKDVMLTDTRTDRKKFPGGLRPLARAMKRRFGVPYMGAWHCHTGYWMGVHPDHVLPSPERRHLMGDAGTNLCPDMREAGAAVFFGAWHRRMRREGVDFIKVDGQGSVVRFSFNRMPVMDAARGSEKALQDSCDRRFKGWMLNCMSMGHELMWTWDRSNLARSSNDFLPRKRGSCDPHAVWNAYNSLWFSQVTWCDWDMWWTRHEAAVHHQALRALSGGPVYVSDRVGRTDPKLLKPLCLSDARLLRCDGVGVPAADCLLTDPGKRPVPLKVVNRAGSAGLAGLFNVNARRRSLKGSFGPADVPGLSGDLFAVRCWRTGETRLMGSDDRWIVRVARREPHIFVAVPVRGGFAAFGLVDKIVSPKTVTRVTRKVKRISVTLVEGGTFAAYSKRTPVRVRSGGRNLPFEWKKGWLTVKVPLEEGKKPVPMRLEIMIV
jgi:hypothetical protein